MKAPQPREFDLHLFAVQLLQFSAAPGVVWFHCPNGESRSPRTGARLKRMGVRRGVADICLVLPGGVAAFLELKSVNGRLSADQRRFREDVEATGGKYIVANSSDAVADALHNWRAVR